MTVRPNIHPQLLNYRDVHRRRLMTAYCNDKPSIRTCHTELELCATARNKDCCLRFESDFVKSPTPWHAPW